MSTAALYYPNVTVVAPRRAGESQDYNRTDVPLLTTALLLWDDLEVIVPYEHFPIVPVIGADQGPQAKHIHDAFELVVRPRWLNEAEKDVLFGRLETLLAGGVPATLRFEPRVDNYNMFPEKLSPRIWHLLEDAGLASDGSDGYYGLKRDFGLIVMGLIADICAGGTRTKVTNYLDAHEAYSRLTATQQRTRDGFKADADGAYTMLASIACKTANVGAFPLERVIALRQREEQDGLLPILRRNYREALDGYVKRLETEVTSAADVKQIERDFERAIRDDFRHLLAMLNLEVGIPILTAGFAVLAALAAQPLGVIGALAIGIPTFQLKRQQTMEKHFSAWLYRA